MWFSSLKSNGKLPFFLQNEAEAQPGIILKTKKSSRSSANIIYGVWMIRSECRCVWQWAARRRWRAAWCRSPCLSWSSSSWSWCRRRSGGTWPGRSSSGRRPRGGCRRTLPSQETLWTEMRGAGEGGGARCLRGPTPLTGKRGKCTLEASPSRRSPPPQLHQATPSSGRAAKALQSTQCMQNSSKQRGRWRTRSQ